MAKSNGTHVAPERQEIHQFQFRGIHLPAQVVTLLADRQINSTELVLLVMIESLVQHGGRGCFATNGYLGSRLGINRRNTVKALGNLRQLGLVTSTEIDGTRYLETSWSRTANQSEAVYNNSGGVSHRDMGGVSHRDTQNKDNKKKAGLRTRSARPTKPAASERHLRWAELLHTIITAKLGIRRAWRKSKWAAELKLLESATSEARVARSIEWYRTNARQFPVQSAAGYSRNFHIIEDKMKRDSAHAESPPHKDCDAVVKKLTDCHWPPGLAVQLPKVISASLRNVERLIGGLNSAKLPKAVKSLASRICAEIGLPRIFVAGWYEKYSERLGHVENPPSRLATLKFSPGGKLDLFCRKVAEEHSGSESRWEKLLEVLDL